MVSASTSHIVKRQRREPPAADWLPLRLFSVPHSNNAHGVTVHPVDFSRIHPSTNQPLWVMIQNYVYKVIFDPAFPIGCIGMSTYTMNFLQLTNHTDDVLVKTFHAGNQDKPIASEIEFKMTFTPSDPSNKTVSAIHVNSVVRQIYAFINQQFFTEQQQFTVPSSQGMLALKVESLELMEDYSTSSSLQLRRFGCINNQTRITITATKDSPLKVMRTYFEDGGTSFHFLMKSFKNPPGGAYGEPMLLHQDSLTQLLLTFHRGKYLFKGEEIDVPFLPSETISLTVKKIQSPIEETIDDCYVRINEQSIITFGSSIHNARIVKGPARIPDAVKVIIQSAFVMDLTGNITKPQWICASQIIANLTGVRPGFVRNQIWTMPIPRGSAIIKIDKIFKDDTLVDLTQHWQIGEFTDVELISAEDFSIPIVDTNLSAPLKSIRFQVKAPEWISNISFPYSVVSNALEKLPFKVFANNQETKLFLPGKTYPLTAVSTSLFFDPSIQLGEIRYGLLGSRTPETTVFIGSNSENLTLVKKTTAEILKDPAGYLAELGIGGIPTKCLEYLSNVIIANGAARHSLADLKIKPSKGILLYGPPGTGKTTLAREIGNFLGIPASRTTHVDAPNLLNKWRGESERMIKELFDNAKAASAGQGVNAPIHLIIIDEIDAIASVRGAGSTSHDTVVNAFLSGLSGLDTSSNFLVVGTTNRLELIDPAVKRPGRLYPHIALGVPDLAGRKQIFEIHLKALKEAVLAPDVDIDTLAAMTDNFTGAEIEAVVQQAINKALGAGFKTNSEGEEFDVTEVKITKSMFAEIIKNTKGTEEHAPWRTMFN